MADLPVRCETCRWWWPSRLQQADLPPMTGTCHIRSVALDRFPLREPEDDCGEWRGRPDDG